jgi:hypothetical protein
MIANNATGKGQFKWPRKVMWTLNIFTGETELVLYIEHNGRFGIYKDKAGNKHEVTIEQATHYEHKEE